jgi:LuxR family maltose regulon positive regulatory protein
MDQILRTKLFVPRLRPEMVPRPHLISQISAGLHGKVTLISGPAGFGKTTLIADWIARTESVSVGWLSLEPADNDLPRFFAYLITALQSADDNISVDHLPDIDDITPATMEAVMTTLVNVIATGLAEREKTGQEKAVLVMDDYHLIDEPSIHGALAFLIDHAPPQLHIVLTTRTDPPLPLARLRARR